LLCRICIWHASLPLASALLSFIIAAGVALLLASRLLRERLLLCGPGRVLIRLLRRAAVLSSALRLVLALAVQRQVVRQLQLLFWRLRR
jgi:hypothetical protein